MDEGAASGADRHLLHGGGKVTISSKDRQAIDAVHQFLEFQRGEHK